MKLSVSLICTMGFLFALAGTALSGRPCLRAADLKPRTTLGTPNKQATFGVGFDTRDSHLALAFSPDGKTLASGSLDGGVRLWDVATGKENAAFKEQPRQVWSLVFSPDGKTLALSGWERDGAKFIGAVWLRDVASGKLKETFGRQRYGIYSVASSPDGKTLASGGDEGAVRLWDLESGREKGTLSKQPHHFLSVAFSPDGKMLAAAGGSVEPGKGGKFWSVVQLWDVSSGKEVASLKGHSHWVSSVAFSPDSKTLASGSYDGTVRLWDVAAAKQKSVFKGRHEQSLVLSVAFTPDGKTIAAGGAEGSGIKADKGMGTVRLWDVTTGQQKATLEPHGPFVTAVVFSPDGMTLASGSGDTTVKLWSVPASNDAKEGEIRKEKEKLIGVWKLVSCEAEGESVPEKILKGEVVRWAITESAITSTVDGEGKDADKYTLDPTTRPKAIDLTDKECRRTPGIYSLDGHTLKVCLNEGGKERPKVFASRLNTHLSVWVFKREKR
jgi:uncharacterized protein (TIGR03067 family)